jgi:hypothetical protein
VSPEISIVRSPCRRTSWGSIDVTAMARHIGSTGVEERSKGTGWITWTPERSHVRPREVSRHCGRPAPKRPGPGGGLQILQERYGGHKDRRIAWAAEANKISDR